MHLYQVPRPRLDPFFDDVPRLYAAAQAPVFDAYQACLYRTEHQFTPADLERIERLWSLEHPDWGTEDPHALIARLDDMRYPDTGAIAKQAAVPGLSLGVVSHYLHFFHHTYPIYSKASVQGLRRLGIDVPWTLVRDPEVYGLYIAALDELKDRVPFWDVPETNVHLSRVVQAALEAYGRQEAQGTMHDGRLA